MDTLHCLLKVVQELYATHELSTIMDIVRHSVRDLVGSDGAAFVLRDGDFCYYAEEDAISPLWKGDRFPMEICISGWVMKHHHPAIIEDVYADPRIPIDVYRKTFIKSLAVVPIKTKDPIGAIGCYWAGRHDPVSEEVEVLQILADTAAIAMDNIYYQDVISAKAKQLEYAVDGTLLVVAKMVEQKDLYTSGHQRRVAAIALEIARALGWSKECCDTIFRAGIVHDIGKIGIPSELLAKPAKLTPSEFGLIKTHTESGYEILKDVQSLMPMAKIILQHHERLDGSGYPYGLKGDDILPEAQVLAVADVFEAMISHRPYRPALGLEAALEELTINKDVLYRSVIVDTVVDLIKNKGYRIPER